jgi:energy-coupling factor transport system substrate-specific component
MSWQVGAFSLLFLALAGGFAWYERLRPDARVIALVATLAALAALGRIAFAALPNVKPTTDIVLISGYALGAGPGFAVGALAGLTSNFFFGQGPWTPWQMAAWGVTGVIGAALAGLTRRRAGRWTLALVCTVVGFAFTAFQDVGDWVTYSDHTLGQLGVYVGQGLGFDAVHAAGCLLFGLAFAPALARSISRFAARLEVRWISPGTIAPLLVAVAAAGWLGGHALSGSAQAATGPLGYLLAAQNSDGGFGPAPGQPSSELYSGWAAMGLAAEGVNPRNVRRRGASLTGYLAAGAGSLSDPGSVERTILAARAGGLSATSFGGRDLVSALRADLRRDGSISEQTNLTSFGVLALRAAGLSPPMSSIRWLIRQQDRDGGFNYGTAGGASDIDDTGAVLEALAGVPGRGTHSAVSRAVRYIVRQQDHDGGFPSYPGEGSNAQSTAWAIQGLIAAGANPGALHRGGAPSPLVYLHSLIAPDGHIRYSSSTNQTPVWTTAEAVMALAGKALPIAAPAAAPTSTNAPTAAHHRATAVSRRVRSSRRRSAGRTARRPAIAQSGPASPVMRYLGLLDALVLAPVGLG